MKLLQSKGVCRLKNFFLKSSMHSYKKNQLNLGWCAYIEIRIQSASVSMSMMSLMLMHMIVYLTYVVFRVFGTIKFSRFYCSELLLPLEHISVGIFLWSFFMVILPL